MSARRYSWISGACEHCDGCYQRHRVDRFGSWVYYGRNDYLRGYVCPTCDNALTRMFDREAVPHDA